MEDNQLVPEFKPVMTIEEWAKAVKYHLKGSWKESQSETVLMPQRQLGPDDAGH